MLNQEVTQIINNLRGRRGYEEKKAKKLGFTSLYDYFEDKLQKQQLAIKNEKVVAKQELIQKEISREKKMLQNKCKCCWFQCNFIWKFKNMNSGIYHIYSLLKKSRSKSSSYIVSDFPPSITKLTPISLIYLTISIFVLWNLSDAFSSTNKRSIFVHHHVHHPISLLQLMLIFQCFIKS